MDERNIKPGFDWAQRLEDEAAWVLHAPTRTVVKVRRFYDGVERVYHTPGTDDEVRGPVLEFEDGSSRHCQHGDESLEAAFIPLAIEHIEYYCGVLKQVGEAITKVVRAGAIAGMQCETVFLLVGVALREQARQLSIVQIEPGG